MKVVRSSPLRTGRLHPQEFSWYSFLEAESTPGRMVPSVASEKIPSDTTGEFFFLFSVLHLYYCFVLIVLAVPFALTVQHTHRKHPCPRRDSNPQSQQARSHKTYALDRAATGIGMIRSPVRPARSESLYRPSYRDRLFKTGPKLMLRVHIFILEKQVGPRSAAMLKRHRMRHRLIPYVEVPSAHLQ